MQSAETGVMGVAAVCGDITALIVGEVWRREWDDVQTRVRGERHQHKVSLGRDAGRPVGRGASRRVASRNRDAVEKR